MSRRTGGRPGYGWSVRQQGGFRPAEKSRLIFKRGAIEPTHEHNLKSNLNRARKEGWSVESHCENCGRKQRVVAFELIQRFDFNPKDTLQDLRNQWSRKPCKDCKITGKTSFNYVI